MFKKILLILLVFCIGFSGSLAYAQQDNSNIVELTNPVGENDI
jgi:hypothetical protein